MKREALLFNVFAAAIFALPAFAADDGITGVQWGRNSYNVAGLPSGPQPVQNTSRLPDGVVDDSQLVGDYRNPILTPYAAAIVKQKGELALAGGFPSAEDQCRPIAPPYSAAVHFDFQILPKKDGDLTIVYHVDNQVRHVRMNGRHPAKLVPSAMGDSIGHWEGGVLVIDTVGIKTDAFISADRFGTPQSDLMHVVERYRLIDGARAAADVDAFEKTEGRIGGRIGGYNPDTKLKGLRLEVTMEDAKVFTQPVTAVVTYRQLTFGWREDVCADNPFEHYKDEWVGLPTENHPGF